ncbi:UDP-N-acetylglucosamine 2-epimerase [Capsaspora owczarzaki ATCC 30864]|uniref:UDP-N-acetylglucosamine 2-epimerase (non-hydrolyzing) n=1 Tax=Capsaspora owczarzaki (strain ATCC 30864) TaxID=595528 RepID=A0A0D2WNV2_CAPO3|nr:UDP-N-acetylglucosamine 2-epimerase [Capsaspora owczarzaki ATCC 30864]KJE92143.1 UDP-N-acetylglucosamine 2-epimerase [Capsaspora owczarzaki ATCC 30864]|eukprot:XP_004364002.1 UDP-N-acetylglucosamine 2-epimerase [Capsaspora owczarzaki ATCC 30864]
MSKQLLNIMNSSLLTPVPSIPTTPLSPSPSAAMLACGASYPNVAARIAERPTATRVLSIFGTRPEVIKFYPVLKEMDKRSESILSITCVTGQHRQMIDPLLSLFDIATDVDLNLMTQGQTLSNLSARLFLALAPVFEAVRPHLVLVQGDTTTAMIAAMCAFYYRVPVGHIEAGLRTNDRYNPFPEEVNRRIVSVVGNLHFAPSSYAADALRAERIDMNTVFVTGNPVIDAIMLIREKVPSAAARQLLDRVEAADAATNAVLPAGQKARHILLTAHRRENHGEGIAAICRAVKRIIAQHKDVHIWYPVHLNPAVCVPVRQELGKMERVHLLDPLEYDVFVHFLDRMYMVMTDSGGIQEEVTALAKPTIVLRETTERPEGVDAGVTKLVGINDDTIVKEATLLLTDDQTFAAMSRKCFPFGDGTAAQQIVDILLTSLSTNKLSIGA